MTQGDVAASELLVDGLCYPGVLTDHGVVSEQDLGEGLALCSPSQQEPGLVEGEQGHCERARVASPSPSCPASPCAPAGEASPFPSQPGKSPGEGPEAPLEDCLLLTKQSWGPRKIGISVRWCPRPLSCPHPGELVLNKHSEKEGLFYWTQLSAFSRSSEKCPFPGNCALYPDPASHSAFSGTGTRRRHCQAPWAWAVLGSPGPSPSLCNRRCSPVCIWASVSFKLLGILVLNSLPRGPDTSQTPGRPQVRGTSAAWLLGCRQLPAPTPTPPPGTVLTAASRIP